MAEHTDNAVARRGFCRRLLAGCLGGLALAGPLGAALASFLAPLRRQAGRDGFVRVASLSALPADGVPRRFPVIAARQDAWVTYPATAIGAVFLRRHANGQLQALHSACPHAGCFVEYAAAEHGFLCPCHNSAFDLDGRVRGARSPSPRPLDELAVEVRQGGEVWVRFQSFLPGVARKTAV